MWMSLTLGIFDVFTYAIPGSLYLVLGAYVATRLGWVDVGDLNTSPSIVLIAAIIIASYLAGHVTYPMGSNLGHLLPLWRRSIDDARDEFTRRVPAAAERPYVRADLSLLQATAESQQGEVAQEISRLRAVGLMIRNCSVPMLLAVVVSIIEAVVGRHPQAAITAAVLLLWAALAGLWQSQRLRHWANLKTLEVCFWIADIDTHVQPAEPEPARTGGIARVRRRRRR
jgi:hypothetical protein